MKLLCTLFVFLLSLNAFSITDEELMRRVNLLETEELRVLLPSEFQGDAEKFAEAMKEHWTFCNYRFISYDEYSSAWGNTEAPFLGFFTKTISGSGYTSTYHQIGLFLKDVKTYESGKVDDVISSIDFPDGFNSASKSKKESYTVLYEFYVKDLQRQIVNVSKGFGTNQIDETIKTNFAKFFDDGQSEMRGKTVLIDEESVSSKFDLEANIQAIRENSGIDDVDMILVPEERILEAIKNREEDKLFYLTTYSTSGALVKAGINGNLVSTRTLHQIGFFSSYSKKGIAANRILMYGISAALLVGLLVVPIIRN